MKEEIYKRLKNLEKILIETRIISINPGYFEITIKENVDVYFVFNIYQKFKSFFLEITIYFKDDIYDCNLKKFTEYLIKNYDDPMYKLEEIYFKLLS